jgi:prepilin-type N-terminal cleavage/methylation domain-containing protein
MLNKKSGFTIVELLIVIVIIGILAAIAITTYNSVQTSAENTKTITAVNATVILMKLYQVQNGTYPVPPNNSSDETYPCVGIYPSNICASINNVNADGTGIAYTSTTFNSKLQTAGSLPQPSTQLVTIGGQQTRGVFVVLTAAPGIVWFLKGSGIGCGITGATIDSNSGSGIRCILQF